MFFALWLQYKAYLTQSQAIEAVVRETSALSSLFPMLCMSAERARHDGPSTIPKQMPKRSPNKFGIPMRL